MQHRSYWGTIQIMAKAAKLTQLCQSSGGTNAGVAAGVWEITAGVLERPGRAGHALSLHLGQSVWASCGWGSPMERRLRHQGDLSLTPAGVAGIWHDEAPARF